MIASLSGGVALGPGSVDLPLGGDRREQNPAAPVEEEALLVGHGHAPRYPQYRASRHSRKGFPFDWSRSGEDPAERQNRMS